MAILTPASAAIISGGFLVFFAYSKKMTIMVAAEAIVNWF